MKAWVGNSWMQQHQIALYLVAITLGCLIGHLVPASAKTFTLAVNPLLVLLMYSTFLAIPLVNLFAGLKDLKFISALLATNFILVPALVFLLTRLVNFEPAVSLGVALVLLAPCVDYVVVFSGIAGGENRKLLASAPLLLLLQMVLIPIFMYLIVGRTSLAVFPPEPFIHALLYLILLPLIAAYLTQMLATSNSWVRKIPPIADYLMVPIMMMTLMSVIGSQFGSISAHLVELVTPMLIFAGFVPIAGCLSALVGRIFRLGNRELIAVTFSGVTRNSLVILPIALSLPTAFSLSASVVVAQTLVELLAMLFMIKVVPKIFVPKKF